MLTIDRARTSQRASARCESSHRWLRGTPGLLLLAALLAGGPVAPAAAQTDFDDFEALLLTLCGGGGPLGAELANRCGEAPNGAPGDLGGASAASLNAGQLLSVTDASISRAQSQQKQIQQRLEQEREENEEAEGREGANRFSLADDTRWSLLLNGRAEFFSQDASGNERPLDGEAFAVQLGVDTRVGDSGTVGALFSYDRTDSRFGQPAAIAGIATPSNEGNLDTNAYSLTVFGSLSPSDATWLDLAFGAGLEQHRFRRRGVFQPTQTTQFTQAVEGIGEPDGWHVSLSAGAGYDFSKGALRLGPYARVNWIHTEIDGYTENDASGSGLALKVRSIERDSVLTTLGLRGSYAFSTPAGVILPQARLEFEREWERDAQDLSAGLALDPGNNVFTAQGNAPDRNYQRLGLAVLWILPNGWMPYVEYQTLFNRADWSSDTVLAGLRLEL